jgi:hypothetical protein
MTSWWPIVLMALLLAAGIVLVAWAMYERGPKREHKLYPNLFSVTVGGLMAVSLTIVGMMVASKRQHEDEVRQAREARSVSPQPSPSSPTPIATPKSESDPSALAARSKHLADIRPVLESEDTQFKQLAVRLKDDGVVVEPESPKEQEEGELRSRFQDENPLSSDLVNHFEGYALRRNKLRGAVRAYTANLRQLYAKVNEQFTVVDKMSGRQQAALAAVKQCTGRAPNVFLREDARSYWFSLGNSAGNGPAPPPPDLVACVRAFEGFKMTPDLEAACKRLRLESEKVSGMARALAREARELSFQTSLSGNCRYLKVE